jgi:nitroimidazol reductase NimA-like FMN-containing flavoprotein (pyridoxamine 5'-phosphate oxidase superfamily)
MTAMEQAMQPDDGTTHLDELSVEECYELIGSFGIGRVAVNVEQLGPLVVPVNFVLDGDVVVFRTDEGTKLRVLHTGPISFQIDSLDPLHRTGWSVLVRGIAYEADDWEIRHLELQPWGAMSASHWIRIVPGAVSGRRITADGLPFDDRGYR